MNFKEYIESYNYTYNNLCSCSLKKSLKKLKKMILKLFIKKNDKVTPEKEILITNDIENQINDNIIIINDDDLYRMYNNNQEELTEQFEKYIEDSEKMDIIDSDEDEWITVNISD